MSDDIEKAVADALTFGTGATLNGQHIPIADLALAAPEAKYCDHCGAPRSVATERCAPPFERQLHQWTGLHPADRAAMAAPVTVQGEVAYIVWNDDRTEGVIFVSQPAYSDPDLPSALDDARQASTGERASMFGSTMAEAFYDAFDEDDDRPIQAVSYAALLALPSPPDAG